VNDDDAGTRTIRTLYEKFGAGDISGLLDHLAEDVEISIPEVENSPYGGIWHGREAFVKFTELLSETEEITDFEVREFISQGERVVVLGRMTATVRATGRHYSTEWINLLTVKNGLITSFTSFFDTAAALRAFQMVTTALK
jgi:uncharacterized protein